ncbi:serine/threonine-protein kinase [Actinopolymorpha sp. B11F2]|uniref:serine/threonine-protein kinase n=1 Tax=Actinopolymorpha sp. B11F2 TaxID=3160862 RepID=UPI0032E44A14
MQANAGVVAGRYRLRSLLGRGGMGEVWQADDQMLGRPVAVKLLATTVSDPADRARFVREARSAAQVSHPNVVAVYDVGEFNERPYMVMELFHGPTLAAELAERGPLPLEEVRRLGAHAAAGLQAAHLAGVVHRDIKPSNLALSGDGVLKLMDFGIARAVDEAATRLTQPGTVVGTASYLAPEQVAGSAGDARSDLYAFGCVLYEMLTGRPPFTGGMAAVLYAHQHLDPEPVSRFRADVPPDLESLILGLLAKHPEHRPTSAGMVGSALMGDNLPGPLPMRGGGGGDATSSMPVHAYRPPDRWSRRPGTALVIAAGLILAVLAGVIIGQILTSIDDDSPAARAEDPTGAASNTPGPSSSPSPSSPSPSTTEQPARYGTAAWLRQVAAAISRLERRGRIDPDVADKVHKRIDEALEKYREGKTDDAAQKIRELTRDLAEAQDKGRLRTDTRLANLLAIAPADSDEGDNDRKGRD